MLINDNMTILFLSGRKIPSDWRHNVSCQWCLWKERLGFSKASDSNGQISTGDIWLDSSWSMGDWAGVMDRDSKSVKVTELFFLCYECLTARNLSLSDQCTEFVHIKHPSKAEHVCLWYHLLGGGSEKFMSLSFRRDVLIIISPFWVFHFLEQSR